MSYQVFVFRWFNTAGVWNIECFCLCICSWGRWWYPCQGLTATRLGHLWQGQPEHGDHFVSWEVCRLAWHLTDHRCQRTQSSRAEGKLAHHYFYLYRCSEAERLECHGRLELGLTELSFTFACLWERCISSSLLATYSGDWRLMKIVGCLVPLCPWLVALSS